MYKIPVTDEDEAPQCNVTAGSQRGELLNTAASGMNCQCVIEEYLRLSIRLSIDACATRCRRPFRAVAESLCAVVTSPASHPRWQAIIEATIKSSPLWPIFEVRELTHPQRDAGDTRYSNFVYLIGDGLTETYSTATATGLVSLEVMTATTDEDQAINFVFPNIDDVQSEGHHHQY